MRKQKIVDVCQVVIIAAKIIIVFLYLIKIKHKDLILELIFKISVKIFYNVFFLKNTF